MGASPACLLTPYAAPPGGSCVAGLGDAVSQQTEVQFRSAYDHRPPSYPTAHLVPWGLAVGVAAALICVVTIAVLWRRRGAVAGLVAIAVLAALLGLHELRGGTPWIPVRSPAGHLQHRPEPYLTPAYVRAPVLHLAMVDDVLHQRYPHLGLAWNQHRVLAAIQVERRAQRSTDPAAARPGLQAMQDEAGAYDREHVPGMAVSTMRRALLWLDALDPPPATPPTTATLLWRAAHLGLRGGYQEFVDRAKALPLAPENSAQLVDDLTDAYYHPDTKLSRFERERSQALSTLSTALLHQALVLRVHGQTEEAAAALDEALQRIQQALALDPWGDPGTWRWQAVAISTLVRTLRDPHHQVLTDLLGDATAVPTQAGTAVRSPVAEQVARLTPEQLLDVADPSHETLKERSSFSYAPEGMWLGMLKAACARLPLVVVGDPNVWHAAGIHRRTPIAVDQPMLGLLDLWVLDGAPQAEIALTLGICCEHMGQLHLAWTAFERAAELAPVTMAGDVLAPFITVLRAHQAWIAHRLAQDPVAWELHERSVHRTELEEGCRLQAAYENAASAFVQHGHDPLDPALEQVLAPLRARLAHAPGTEDQILTWIPTWRDRLADGLVGAAVLALLTLTAIPRRRPPAASASSGERGTAR